MYCWGPREAVVMKWRAYSLKETIRQSFHVTRNDFGAKIWQVLLAFTRATGYLEMEYYFEDVFFGKFNLHYLVSLSYVIN